MIPTSSNDDHDTTKAAHRYDEPNTQHSSNQDNDCSQPPLRGTKPAAPPLESPVPTASTAYSPDYAVRTAVPGSLVPGPDTL